MAKKKQIQVEGIDIRVMDTNSYICLTDIARKVDERTDIVLSNWLRNSGTLDFLYEWEMMYNEKDFNPIKFDGIRKEAGKVGFVMSAKKWIEETGAIGIDSKAGRYGGTFAHKDIAYEFCTAVSASFKLALIQGFDLLIEEKYNQLGRPYEITRLMTKGTFPLLTEGIKDSIPRKIQGTKKEGVYFANGVDMINTIVFGMTASEWKKKNPNAKPSENMRDHASAKELIILTVIQGLDERLRKWGCDEEQRFDLLADAKKDWYTILQNRKTIKDLEKRITKQRKLRK